MHLLKWFQRAKSGADLSEPIASVGENNTSQIIPKKKRKGEAVNKKVCVSSNYRATATAGVYLQQRRTR